MATSIYSISDASTIIVPLIVFDKVDAARTPNRIDDVKRSIKIITGINLKFFIRRPPHIIYCHNF